MALLGFTKGNQALAMVLLKKLSFAEVNKPHPDPDPHGGGICFSFRGGSRTRPAKEKGKRTLCISSAKIWRRLGTKKENEIHGIHKIRRNGKVCVSLLGLRPAGAGRLGTSPGYSRVLARPGFPFSFPLSFSFFGGGGSAGPKIRARILVFLKKLRKGAPRPLAPILVFSGDLGFTEKTKIGMGLGHNLPFKFPF